MEKTALVGALLADPEAETPCAETLLIENGVLVDRLPAGSPTARGLGEEWRSVPLEGKFVAPGFLDLHFHGELMTVRPGGFPAALERAGTRMLRSGATGFLATTFAWSRENLGPFVTSLADAIADSPGSSATCLGLHLEGPWISANAPGAMSTECIRPFVPSDDIDVLDRAGDLLRMVTLAPEAQGADALLRELDARGAIASLGHSRATAPEIDRGIAQGLRHVTHLFNAMGPVHHREPGVAGSVMARDSLTCDLICDGFHVHPDMLRIAARALRERLVLITDRVDFETPTDTGQSGDAAPLRLADGTLAGSQLDLDVAIRNARHFAGLELCEAVAACSLRPARLLGLENQRGTLRRGARADLAVLDDSGRVLETWMAGRPVWKFA